MTRTVTDPAAANRGSRRWLQLLVNCCRKLLNEAISRRLGDPPSEIDWRSPLISDHYAEYRDLEFIDRLESSRYLTRPLQVRRPWPNSGQGSGLSGMAWA